MGKPETIKILGIDFFNGTSREVVERLKSGGLLVVPAAPALINIKEDTAYHNSLLNANIVIPDSGYMTLIWNFTHSEKVTHLTGLKFLIDFIADTEVRNTKEIVLVDPRSKDAEINIKFLNSNGFSISEGSSYLAPMYDKSAVKDENLLKFIEEKKPKYVMINLGGGTQEKLGSYLKDNLSYTPAIICTGAAIAFLTGQQAKIPAWADNYSLGWLFRCVENPKLYVPRYLKAFKLAGIMLKNGARIPV